PDGCDYKQCNKAVKVNQYQSTAEDTDSESGKRPFGCGREQEIFQAVNHKERKRKAEQETALCNK
ncbi:hypothetical protein OFB70_30715, partial [Escherichia coli]|nr:hypothetical protein [Escherichia coli]